jgi:hypothetical protein
MNQYNFESGFNIRKLLITASVVLLFSYGIFNARNLIMGPSIEMFNPIADTEVSDKTITVKGKVENISFISLNGRAISVDREGLFNEKLILVSGLNVIEIKARDRFKNEVQKVIKVYYKESENESININASSTESNFEDN